VFGPALTPWPGAEGGPPVLLGAWRSARWIRLAAETYQGWIASGIFSEWEDLQAGLKMYRAAGGKRAVLANVFTDLRAEPALNPTAEKAKISLYCPPTEARHRLQRLEQLGFDDALLVCPFDAPEQLETLRALI
jgi:alkanesulfonate monooxygenase SsuD/methylene tetrahydromethanopterin reductase-like flavin-dependent oxidoreductase (luciferase family)